MDIELCNIYRDPLGHLSFEHETCQYIMVRNWEGE